jgi:uncharacterized membrane protein (UPF0127 family)
MNKQTSLVIILSLLLVSCNPNSAPQANEIETTEMINRGQQLPITAIVEIKGEKIDLEVAQTPQQLTIGLMYRDSLPPNRGMLFPFQPPRIVSFWMKNVSIPLDMIFLSQGVIQHIESNVPPCQTPSCPVYGPKVKVDQVLELAGGRATELNLNMGDRLEVKFLSSQNSH